MRHHPQHLKVVLRVMTCAAVLAMAAACAPMGNDSHQHDDRDVDDAGEPTAERTRHAFHEHEFTANPELHAQLADTVVFHFEHPTLDALAQDSGGPYSDDIRYEVPTETMVELCLPDAREHLETVRLHSTAGGDPLFALNDGAPCTETLVPPGRYVFSIHHSGAGEAKTRTLFFRGASAPPTPTADANSNLRLVLTDGSCPGCDLTYTTWSVGTSCEKCILTGADLSFASINGTVFDDCELGGAHFIGANLTDVRFQGGNLKDASMASAHLNRTHFAADGAGSKPIIEGLNVMGTTVYGPSDLSNLDLRLLAWNNSTQIVQADVTLSTLPYRLVPLARWRTGLHLDQTHFTDVPANLAYANFSGLDLATSDIDFPATVDLSHSVWKDTKVGNKDFSAFQLSYADFSGADFSGAGRARFEAANLTGAVFGPLTLADGTIKHVNADRADFLDANLTNANFTGAQLNESNFTNAELTSANFTSAVFESGTSVSFAMAVMINANLRDARLAGADFSHTDLHGPNVVLAGANLVGARFIDANLANVDLSGVNARGSEWNGANLIGANLFQTDFSVENNTNTTLENAYLCGAVLDSTNLSGAHLVGAYIPDQAQNVPGPGDTTVQCAPTTLVNLTQSSTTLCPNGAPGPCDSAAAWHPVLAAAQPCCTPSRGTFCPSRRVNGQACNSNCDCRSSKCVTNVCAPN